MQVTKYDSMIPVSEYHDIEVEFEGQPRIALCYAPDGWELSYIKHSGWVLYACAMNEYDTGRILAEDKTSKGVRLSLWVKGIQILDRTDLQS